jgi:hypothetical protein
VAGFYRSGEKGEERATADTEYTAEELSYGNPRVRGVLRGCFFTAKAKRAKGRRKRATAATAEEVDILRLML